MQSDEDIGKVAQATPVVVAKALELFMTSLIQESCNQARCRNAKRVSPAHLKQAVKSIEHFDFLVEMVEKYPDPVGAPVEVEPLHKQAALDESAADNEDEEQESSETQQDEQSSTADVASTTTKEEEDEQEEEEHAADNDSQDEDEYQEPKQSKPKAKVPEFKATYNNYNGRSTRSRSRTQQQKYVPKANDGGWN